MKHQQSLIGAHSRRVLLTLLVILGLASGSTVYAAIAGGVDLSFGVAGKAETSFPAPSFASDIAQQTDGKLVVVGSYGFTVARYLRDGALDPTFGNGGVVYAILNGSTTEARAVAVQADGKIVVAGYGFNSEHSFIVLRLKANGSLDTDFGVNGVTHFEIANHTSYATSLALQPNGGIVLAGTTQFDTGQADILVVRFLADGKVDLNFGNAGAVAIPNGTTSYGNAVVSLADNRILVGGTTLSPTIAGIPNWDFIMARLNNNGSFDGTFAAGGLLVTSIAPGRDEINALALQPDGKIIATGMVQSDNYDLAIVRYTAAGALDVGNFGSGGKLLVDFDTRRDYGTAVAIDPSGYIVAAGWSEGNQGNSIDSILVRCEPDGDLDPSFGVNGKVRTGNSQVDDFAQGVVLQPTYHFGQPNGYKIVTTGGFSYPSNRFITTRFHGRSGPIDRAVVNDFDGDGVSDLALFHNTVGNWRIGKVPPTGSVSQVTFTQFGANGDRVVPGDYDGDGTYDLAVYRVGVWYILTSQGNFLTYSFGLAADIPVPGDYDGDGRTDVAVFRPSNGTWYYVRSSDNSFVGSQWGANGDIPVVGDYDGDDRADLAVYRAGTWYILNSANNQLRVEYFGLATDKTVPFDYDGDSKTDLGVFRSGVWYYVSSADNAFHGVAFGSDISIPIPGRYDIQPGLLIYTDGTWALNGRGAIWQTPISSGIPVRTYFAQ